MPRGRRRSKTDLLTRSAEMIGWALGGIEREIAQTRERLSTLTDQAAKLRGRLGAAGRRGVAAAASAYEPAARRKRKRQRQLSPEGRKAISDRMKKRWAEYRKAKAKQAAR